MSVFKRTKQVKSPARRIAAERCGAFRTNYEMKLKYAKYLIILFLLTTCAEKENVMKNYGFSKNENDNLNVPIKISEFKNFGNLVDRIREINCNDSIPKIVIERKNLIKNIFPTENCNPLPFNPEGKHYITFWNGKPYEFRSKNEIEYDSLNFKIKDFAYFQTSNKTETPNFYLIIVESERDENLKGMEKLLIEITDEFDKLNTKLDLNILFWEIPPNPPPIPAK